jgi:quercetin dioxygenase-like cupin family protein
MSYFTNRNNIEEKELVPGIHVRMIHMEGTTVMHVRIEAGAKLPEHHHIHEQVTNILEGDLEMTVGGETHHCKAGDVVTIPSDVPHSAVSHNGCYAIDVFQPVREDYKKLLGE